MAKRLVRARVPCAMTLSSRRSSTNGTTSGTTGRLIPTNGLSTSGTCGSPSVLNRAQGHQTERLWCRTSSPSRCRTSESPRAHSDQPNQIAAPTRRPIPSAEPLRLVRAEEVGRENGAARQAKHRGEAVHAPRSEHDRSDAEVLGRIFHQVVEVGQKAPQGRSGREQAHRVRGQRSEVRGRRSVASVVITTDGRSANDG